MSKKAATVGDIGTDHDGFPSTPIIEGSQDIFIDNKPAARVGDALAPHAKPGSPPHDRTITTGSKTVFFNGKPAALTGSKVGCGGVIIGGSSVTIGDQPASGIGNAFWEEVTKNITKISFSYGLDCKSLLDVSRHYTDINLHVKTVGYLPGEEVSIKLSGVIDKTITGIVDERGEVFIFEALKDSHLELEGSVI